MTAAEAGLVTCHACALLCPRPTTSSEGRCHRCGARLHGRKVNSLQKTWALVIAAAVLYVPANALPVMKVTTLGRAQTDTIMTGVIHLLQHGMWPLAALVFIASVVVPLMKLLSLVFLLVSVQRRSRWRPVERTRMYRITEAIGRWSMVDIYVVTVLVSLVHLESLASIEAGAGAVFFGAVVVVTIIAAESFDPRLIWDNSALEAASK